MVYKGVTITLGTGISLTRVVDGEPQPVVGTIDLGQTVTLSAVIPGVEAAAGDGLAATDGVLRVYPKEKGGLAVESLGV